MTKKRTRWRIRLRNHLNTILSWMALLFLGQMALIGSLALAFTSWSALDVFAMAGITTLMGGPMVGLAIIDHNRGEP
jgi:hypothetical protein